MDRRCFLQIATAVAATSLRHRSCVAEERVSPPQVMTVTGEVAAAQLGTMLPHEHILVDFVGADQVSPDRYDAEEAFQVMLPVVQQAQAAGCQTIAECTPAFLGRDPRLLQRISRATGVNILTNTGLYGARQGKFLPPYALRESATQLANRWVDEWRNGIESTGVRPGFIKIGVDAGELTEVNRKLIEAAARCHLVTGLVIAAHTGNGQAAGQQVEILQKMGVAPSAWIWVHAQGERDVAIHREIATAGAWIEFDGVSPDSIDRHVELITGMRKLDLLDRVLLSHDAGWYSVGEPRGGSIRGFDTLFTKFLPALRAAGLQEHEIQQLVVANPARAFAIDVRGFQ